MTWAMTVATLAVVRPPLPTMPAFARPLQPLMVAASDVAPADSLALAFGTALAKGWAGDCGPMADLLHEDVQVDTPLWKCDGRTQYEKELLGAARFLSALSTPTLMVLSQSALGDGGSAKVEWMLGVEWPAVWRPRINLLGTSTLTLGRASDGTPVVRRVKETWHQTPAEAFVAQLLPKLRDVTSIWASPTAEHYPMPTVRKCNGYSLRRLPPMLALQAEWVETGSMLRVEQAPLPPAFAFTGEVKRSEWYSAVSPAFVERALVSRQMDGGMSQNAQRRRWFAPLPLRFGDDLAALPRADAGMTDDVSVPDPVVSSSVQFLRRPAQLLAVRRLRQSPSNQAVLSTALEITAAVEKDGGRVTKSEGRPVVLQMSGDIKYGFNEVAVVVEE